MKRITSHRGLVERYAAEGDPSAFLTLMGSGLKDIYTSMRCRGLSHKQAMSTLLPFVRKTYRKFVRTRPGVPPEEWLKLQMKNIPGAGRSTDTGEVFIGNIDSRGIDDFEYSVQLCLQREYGTLRNAAATGSLSADTAVGRSVRRVVGIVLIVLALCAGFLGLQVLLSSAKSGVSVTITLPSHIVTFSFPSASRSCQQAMPVSLPDIQSDSLTAGSPDKDTATALPKKRKQVHVQAGRKPVARKTLPVRIQPAGAATGKPAAAHKIGTATQGASPAPGSRLPKRSALPVSQRRVPFVEQSVPASSTAPAQPLPGDSPETPVSEPSGVASTPDE